MHTIGVVYSVDIRFGDLATNTTLSYSDAPITELADFLINRYLMADNSRYQ